MTTKILKSLVIAALLSCAGAHAKDPVYPASADGASTESFQVSELRCQLVEGQIRCTFGS